MTALIGQLIRGAAAGVLATLVMDRVTTRIQATRTTADAKREEAARPRGKDPATNLADRAVKATGATLRPKQRKALASVTHYALGALPGAAYAVLRPRLRFLSLGRGALYGVLLWGLNDELLNTLSGVAGPPEAYPASSHLRGLAGHVALGVSTNTALDILSLT